MIGCSMRFYDLPVGAIFRGELPKPYSDYRFKKLNNAYSDRWHEHANAVCLTNGHRMCVGYKSKCYLLEVDTNSSESECESNSC